MMVGRPIPAGLSRVVSWLRCPVCAVPLELTGRTLGCENHHCFDVARQGHLNLLLRAAPKNADTPEMIAARDRFLSTGWYEPLTRTVVTALDGACRVLEAGAGTGHHIAAFLDATPGATCLAVDVSPAACRHAARRSPRLGAVVTDIWRRLPIATGSLDAVLCVFAPRNPAEFARVLTPGGRLVVVTPGREHLVALRNSLGLLGIESEKLERLDRSMTGFKLVDRQELTHSLHLPAEATRDLIAMGPNAFHPHAAVPDTTKTTAAFVLSTFHARDH